MHKDRVTMSAKGDVLDKPYLLHVNGVPVTTDGRVMHLELAAGDGEIKVYLRYDYLLCTSTND